MSPDRFVSYPLFLEHPQTYCVTRRRSAPWTDISCSTLCVLILVTRLCPASEACRKNWLAEAMERRLTWTGVRRFYS